MLRVKGFIISFILTVADRVLESHLYLASLQSTVHLSLHLCAEHSGALYIETLTIMVHCQQVCKHAPVQEVNYIIACVHWASRLGTGEDPGTGNFHSPYSQ